MTEQDIVENCLQCDVLYPLYLRERPTFKQPFLAHHITLCEAKRNKEIGKGYPWYGTFPECLVVSNG